MDIVAGFSSALPLNMTKSHKTKAKAGSGAVQSNQTLAQQSSVVSPLASAQVCYYDRLLIAFLGKEASGKRGCDNLNPRAQEEGQQAKNAG